MINLTTDEIAVLLQAVHNSCSHSEEQADELEAIGRASSTVKLRQNAARGYRLIHKLTLYRDQKLTLLAATSDEPEECEDNACAGCPWCDAQLQTESQNVGEDEREWDDGTMGGRDQFEGR
jgi:hypothetical protein